jgi:cholestenol delta-isomerase
LQIIISLGQIYGDALYYATSLFDLYYHGTHFCRPEGYYFWMYYFLMNSIWIIVPACQCFTRILYALLTSNPLCFFQITCSRVCER